MALPALIAIGASHCGLTALCRLMRSLPADLEAALAVVLHTPARSPGLLADIVGRHTELSVSYGGSGRSVERGHVYIAPPDYHLLVRSPGVLRLEQGAWENCQRPAADPLFRSAAEVYGSRAIGVILTGSEIDGEQGLQAIKAAGGVTVMESACVAARGQASLRNHHRPDYRVSLSEMAPLLTRLAKAVRDGACSQAGPAIPRQRHGA
jgi:two-component system chemotaxis response regulator CheB